MNRFLLVPILLFLKFFFDSLTGIQWVFFDPLLALVVVYTFFHSLDVKDFILYGLFCGICRDIMSADVFGIYILGYLFCSIFVAFACRLLYRQYWVFILPLCFLSIFLNHLVIFFLKVFLSEPHTTLSGGLLVFKILLEAVGTTAFSYFFYLYSKKCVPGLIGQS